MVCCVPPKVYQAILVHDYSKSQAKQELTEKTGWLDYGGHHLENLATAFLHEIWLPKRFGVDFRNLKFQPMSETDSFQRGRQKIAVSKPWLHKNIRRLRQE